MRGFRLVGACALACVALVVSACQTPTTGTNTPPTASFTATPPAGVAPLEVTFDASASFDTGGSIASYSWNFGDGETDTGVIVNHTFTADGTYAVALTVTDNGGKTATTTRVVTVGAVNVPPIAVAGASATSGVAPLAVTFSSVGSADTDGSIVGFEWDFGDGSPTTTTAAPTHTYATAGIYSAVLTVTDDDGAVGSDSVTVTVSANQPPVAAASSDVNTGKAPLTVAFSSAGSSDPDGTIAAYSWDFGDSTPTSSSANPSHTYAAAGSYTATLTVTDNLGATASHSVAIEATQNQSPVAVADSDVSAGNAPLIVNFDGTASTDPDGTVVSYAWNFGGSNSSSSATPQYTFPTAGTYPVTLTVTDDSGATDTATITIEVGEAPNVPPTAVAGATPTSGKRNLTVSFSSSGSTDSDGTIQSRSWNFGDGGSSTSANPTHTYTVAGTYTATLTVTDNAGAIDTDTITITVDPNQPPVAVAGANQTVVKTGVSVTFSSAGTTDPDGTVASRSWDFGDGGTSTAANPAHAYASPGTYTAVLTATDDTGDSSTASVVITVNANQAPTAVLNATPQTGPRPLVVNFSSAGSTDGDGTIASYAWDFGNGTTSTAQDPTATFAAGTYTATLTITDDNGATDSESVTITAVIDDDADGVSPPTDCNDNDASVKPGAADALDAAATDSNCDGVDGVLADTILVANSGADNASCGTAEATPCQTLPYAIGRAGTSRHVVLVTGGLTSSTASISGVSGFTVRGGYGADFTSRSGTTTINGGSTVAGSTGVVLSDLTINGPGGANSTGVLLDGSTATLSGVTVDSGTPTGAGSSAYGVRAIGSSNVTITGSTITAKPGVAGAPGGAAAPAKPGAGCDGPNGANASGASSPGSGGNQTCGSGTVKGGNGGTGGDYWDPGGAGSAGGGGAAGGNGGCGSAFGCGTDAGGGAGGAAGAAGGAGGGGGNAVTSAGNTFVGLNGGPGSGGGVGGGGGGGGGGKSASASGGGGGAGGNGGVGGAAATAAGSYGGGSFGVYAYNATISLTNTTVTAAAGGAGGAGSPGGAGANGGKGGNGGSDSCCLAGGGGGGGAGAGGGGGGGAGGGAGGPSIAVFHGGTGTYTGASVTLNRSAGAASGGAGGAGGAGGTAGGVGSGNDGSGAGGTAGAGNAGATGNAGASGLILRVWNNGSTTS